MSLNYQSGPWDELNPRGDEKVSDFLQNLYSVLKNPEFLDVLSWNDGGDAFVVKDLLRMRDDVLPLYYNHNDLESFNKELINLGFQQVNIQNNQTLYFHLKFKMDPGSFTSHLAKQDDKIAKINFEIPVEGSTPRAGNGDASILDTVKNQIGNNELYWEFIKMKLRISEIEDSNSKLLKKVDELTARMDSLQNELVSERQRNEQLIKQNVALNEQIYQSEAKNSEGKNSSSQMNSEDFEKTIANLEKALNLSGNIQLLQENLAMASAANDKRLILSNIERLRDFLKAKRSLEVLSQKKKKKRVEKEKRIQSDGEFRNDIDFQDRLIDQIRKIPKSESLNTTVFNQLAKNLPQTAAINSRFQGLGEQFSPFKMDELALRPFSTNQFSNGEHAADYTRHSASPALRYATDHLITQQHGQEKVTIHSRVEQYQTNYSGSMNTKPLETSFQNKNQLMDQDMLPFLQNPSEITLSMTRKASRDQIQESNPAGTFFLPKDSQETTNHLNQPHFARGVADSLPEGTSTNYSPSAEFVSHLQKPVLPNDNFQLSGAENYLDNLSQLPLCHQQNPSRGGEDLPHQFYYSDSNNTANKYMIGFEGQQPQVTENGTTDRETRADYDQRANQQESTFDQYNNFSHSKVPHSSELDQLFQKSIHNYSL